MGLFSTLFSKRAQPSLSTESDTLTVTLDVESLPLTPEPLVEPELELSSVVEVIAPIAMVPAASLPEAVPPADSSQVRAQAEEIVRSVVQELPEFITVAVVEIATGRILAGKWAGHSGGAVEVAVANAEIVRQMYQVLEALQLSSTEQLEDIVVMLRYQLHILRVLPQLEWLLYLAVRTQDSNLGLARTVLRNQVA